MGVGIVMNRALSLLVVSFGMMILLPRTASAHVLIQDVTGTVGAVLHITPGDDPVAGMPSTISLSIDDTSLSENNSKFTIKNKADESIDAIQYTQNKGTLTAEYVFPTQGTYELRIMVRTTKNKNYDFTYVQRVSKGVGTNIEDSTHPLARFIFLSTSIALVYTIVFFVKRRAAVFNQSTF